MKVKTRLRFEHCDGGPSLPDGDETGPSPFFPLQAQSREAFYRHQRLCTFPSLQQLSGEAPFFSLVVFWSRFEGTQELGFPRTNSPDLL